MNYELAKQLKDAGFPQAYGQGVRDYIFPNGAISRSNFSGGVKDDRGVTHMALVPTLSELIEECNKKNIKAITLVDYDAFKRAGCIYPGTTVQFIFDGESYEDALAKLWLLHGA